MSDYGSGGGENGPVFVDVYGTGRRLGLKGHRRGLEHPDNRSKGPHGFEGPHPDGPFWQRGLKGLLPLWTVFWGGFFFGHGILLVISIVLIIPAIIVGMTIDPARTGVSLLVTEVVAGLIGTMIFLFVMWSLVAVLALCAECRQRKVVVGRTPCGYALCRSMGRRGLEIFCIVFYPEEPIMIEDPIVIVGAARTPMGGFQGASQRRHSAGTGRGRDPCGGSARRLQTRRHRRRRHGLVLVRGP